MTGQSSNVVYAYALQVDATTPATGVFTALRRRTASLTSTIADIDDGEISSNRLADAPGAGRQTHAASFEFNFRELVLDDLLRSAFASDWVVAGVNETLSLGKAPVYLTIVTETSYLGDATRHYTQYTGCTVSSLNMTFPQDGYIGMSVDVSAATKTYPTAAPWSSLVDADNKQKLRTCTALTEVQLATTTAGALAEVASIVTDVDFTLTNATEDLFDVRQCDPKEIVLGTATIAGNINAYHDDESDQWYKDADDTEEMKTRWIWKGETTTYQFDVPQGTNKSPGFDTSSTTVAVNLPWGAVTQSPTITKYPN